MREIKIKITDKTTLETEVLVIDNEFDCHSGWLENKTTSLFTGFKDKNGNEIFEGDNLTDVVETDEGKINSKQKVFWNEPTGSWHLDNSFEQDETNSTELWIELNDFKYKILT